MSSPVDFPPGFDQKGFRTCKKGDEHYDAYWSTKGKEKLYCWVAIASPENKTVAMEYRNDPEKFQRERGGVGLKEDVFIKFQSDLIKQFGNVERGITAAMNLEMIRILSERYNICTYKPLGERMGVTQDIDNNVDHLIQALEARVITFVDDKNFDQRKGELFLELLRMVVDIVYGCVSGPSTESWKQKAVRDSLELNPGYTLGAFSVGSKSPFSISMEKGYAGSRKPALKKLERCGFILRSQKPKGPSFEVGDSTFHVQLNSKAKRSRVTAVEALVRLGLAAKESGTKFELAAKMLEATKSVVKEEARRIRESSGEECPPHLNRVIQQIDSLTGEIRSFDNSRSLDNSGKFCDYILRNSC